MALSNKFPFKQWSRISFTAVRTYFSSRQEIESCYSKYEDIIKFQDTIKKCIDTQINPHVEKWEAEEDYPAHSVFKMMGDIGIFGIGYPTEYGGLNLNYRYKMAAAEALGNIRCGGVPTAISVQMDMSTPALARFGSPELKAEFLAPTISGDYVSCVAVSEPHAGSDVANIKTTAKRVGDDLIINGQKMWITNAFHSDWICLLANTSDGNNYRNKSLICVHKNTPGVNLTKKIDKMGLKCSDQGQIFFDDVRVPAKNIIGEAGQGFLYQMLQFQQERLIVVAIAIPALEICINETINYVKDRHIFGKPILYNQVVHFRLAEMMTEIECLKSLLQRAVDLVVEGKDVTMLASMAKLKVGRLSREITDSCLQYWGGMGFTNEVLISRMYRDMRGNSIAGGADEVMLSIICKMAGILPKEKKN